MFLDLRLGFQVLVNQMVIIRKMFLRQLRKIKGMNPKSILVFNFLCLLLNLFMVVMQLNRGIWPVETFFQPVLTDEDRKMMLDTLKAFVGALEASNLTYMMYAGTLIGSYRHHGPIPWDDDIDLLLNASQKQQIKDALISLQPHYDVYIYDDDLTEPTQWKFYANSVSRFIHKPYKWPYLDLFFFKENDTHIWDEVPRFAPDYVFPKNKVFPLQRRPFADMELPGPCEPGSILNNNYNIDLCRSRSFSHMMEMPMFTFKTKDVPCNRLHRYFPFVFRTFIDGTMNETLKIGDWTLKSVTLPTYCKGRHP